MIYLLFILLIILLVIAFFCFKKDLIAPAVLFIAGFVYSTGWALAYAADWDLANMRLDTFLVILGGCLVFLITSVIVNKLFKKYTPEDKEKNIEKRVFELPELKIPNWIKIASLVFMAVSLFVCIRYIIETTNGSWSNIPAAISSYDRLTKFDSEIVKMPFYVSLVRMATTALAYWFMYVFVNELLIKRKKWWQRIEWLSLSVVCMDIIILFSSGGRNGVVNLLIAALTLFVVLYYKKNVVNFKLKPKWWLLIIALFAGFLVAFPRINALLGRNVAKDTNYYLAIYSGAEIKNLDIFLEKRENESFVNSGNNQTFVSINNTMMKAFHYGTPYKLDLPFQKVVTKDNKTLSLGNVYTTFYQFIYDYGYLGVLWCTALAAAISQFVYEKARRAKMNNMPNIYILVYSFVSNSLLLSFFSNKFYEQNFNKAFFFNIVVWIGLNIFLSKIFITPQQHKKLVKKTKAEGESKNVKER